MREYWRFWVACAVIGASAVGGLIACVVALVNRPEQQENALIGRAKTQTATTLDVVNVYAEASADLEKAKEKYEGKRLAFRGVVSETIVTGFGTMMHLQHARGQKGQRYIGRVLVAFPIQKQWDMGWEHKFDDLGLSIIPWRDGSEVTVTGACEFRTRDGQLEMSIGRAHLD